jgi:Lrp/AsnC family leucine-responsive transcriptional regulator
MNGKSIDWYSANLIELFLIESDTCGQEVPCMGARRKLSFRRLPPMATLPELDRLDRRILDILQREGRISMTELGERIGLSTSPVAERVRRLERTGVITGWHARVDPRAVNRGMLVFVEITLSAKSGEIFDQVRRALLHMDEVLECHLVSGSFDYLVKARLSGMEDYRGLLGDILRQIPVPCQSHSYVVMEEVKETTVLGLG